MNKERVIVTAIVGLLIVGGLIAAKATDGIFVATSIAFFLLCIAYAEGCERL